eukprot:scaffold18592_cov42-Phaeocystis_antarctica.AAC.2
MRGGGSALRSPASGSAEPPRAARWRPEEADMPRPGTDQARQLTVAGAPLRRAARRGRRGRVACARGVLQHASRARAAARPCTAGCATPTPPPQEIFPRRPR